jgi:hypothetical protein
VWGDDEIDLQGEWQIHTEVIHGWGPNHETAVLQSYWTDLSCGCTFGALQVVHLEGAA